METNDAIHKHEQQLAKHERHLALLKIKERKQDTRRKIEFGGLVIKAKMDGFSKAIILGALLDAYQQIQNDADVKKLFQVKGEAGFMRF